MLGPVRDLVDRAGDRLVVGRLRRVDRSADDVVPTDARSIHRGLEVAHRADRLTVQVVGNEREVHADAELAGEMDDLAALGDGDVAEPGRRMELRRVDELSGQVAAPFT